MLGPWIVGTVAAVFAGPLVFLASFLPLWLEAYFAGTNIGFPEIVRMYFRNADPKVVVRCQVMAVQSGLAPLPTSAIESLYLSGGDVRRVTLALIAADRAGLGLDWDTAAAIDLAGRDIMEAVRVSVNPKVIFCPDPNDQGADELFGVAKDGIQLRVRVRVTVRTNLAQLVGGATEATIVARVGQGIVSAIGACESHREALGDPLLITRQVVAKGLDAQSAFSIVSIDIAEIDVGENIGAKLRIDQAEADVRVARADAEKRRAMAVSRLQEMQAQVARSRAAKLLAEAEIPTALAESLRAGLGSDRLSSAWAKPAAGRRGPWERFAIAGGPSGWQG